MSKFTLSAGSMVLIKQRCSDVLTLGVSYNEHDGVSAQIRGEDELYALQHLVNRAVAKIEAEKQP